MSEIMIIGSSQVLTASGADGTENHLRFGAENDRVTLIQRTWADIHDMFDDAAKLKKRYAIKHFIVAPYRPMSRRLMLTVALPAIAKEFEFDPLQCSVVEHEKDRTDPEAFNIHWHVVTTHFNPDTKHVIDWWQDYMRQEKVGEILEYQLWLLDPDRDPAGPDFLIGRHHDAVIASLRDEKTPEYHPIADALERAHPLGSVPEGTAPAANVVRMHAREGRNIVQLRKVCNTLWRATTDADDFIKRMEDEHMFVTLGDEPPPRWIVKDRNGKVLGTLASMAHAKVKDVYSKMGDPKYDEWFAGRLGRGDDDDLAEHRNDVEVAEEHVAGVPVVEVQPDGPGHGKVSPELFIAALRRVDPARVKELKDRAIDLAQNAFAHAVAYLAKFENAARDYLTWTDRDELVPTDELAALRKKRAALAARIKACDKALTTAPEWSEKRAELLDIKGRARVDMEDLDKDPDFIKAEADYAKDAVQYREVDVKEKFERAHRYLRIIPRVRALIDHAPQVLWAGIQAIFTRAVLADKAARPGARFRVETPLPPPPADNDTDHKPPGSTM